MTHFIDPMHQSSQRKYKPPTFNHPKPPRPILSTQLEIAVHTAEIEQGITYYRFHKLIRRAPKCVTTDELLEVRNAVFLITNLSTIFPVTNLVSMVVTYQGTWHLLRYSKERGLHIKVG